MSSIDTSPACARTVRSLAANCRSAATARLADYLELTKPRIAVLVLLTVAVGFALGSGAGMDTVRLMHALVGIALVAAGSSAMNQWLERDTDSLMARTAGRPLPAGRLQPREALAFGVAAGTGGCLYLALRVNLLTASLAAATLALYAFIYTPLKRRTAFCTAVGAVPGALPPVLGWTAATGRLEAGAAVLFAILFLWQFPHFLAIGWLYREQYRAAGLRMLPASEPRPRVTGLMCVLYAAVLVPVSLLPGQVAVARHGYAAAALVLGLGYVLCAARFFIAGSRPAARGLLMASIVYLPLLLLTMTFGRVESFWLSTFNPQPSTLNSQPGSNLDQ
ncbi:MAG: heme o synthase [Planctomycetes bacterium]|nr:heme o synthase [Planctomycetota bacterium]